MNSKFYKIFQRSVTFQKWCLATFDYNLYYIICAEKTYDIVNLSLLTAITFNIQSKIDTVDLNFKLISLHKKLYKRSFLKTKT